MWYIPNKHRIFHIKLFSYLDMTPGDLEGPASHSVDMSRPTCSDSHSCRLWHPNLAMMLVMPQVQQQLQQNNKSSSFALNFSCSEGSRNWLSPR